MNRSVLRAATLLALSLAANAAFSAMIPYKDGFNNITTTQLNTAPPGWVANNGTVDWVAKPNIYGIKCFGNSKGCVDLDGTSMRAAVPFETASGFKLQAGHTYELSAEISGNQRNGAPDDLQFGFLKGTTLAGIQAQQTITGLSGAGHTFTLYELFYKPLTAINVRAFFYNIGGMDNVGPILDNVSVREVPLPAAAWLMLSGLAALGAVARRRINGATAA